jgi:hypothetical protein
MDKTPKIKYEPTRELYETPGFKQASVRRQVILTEDSQNPPPPPVFQSTW